MPWEFIRITVFLQSCRETSKFTNPTLSWNESNKRSRCSLERKPLIVSAPSPITTIQFSAPPPSSHTKIGSTALQNFCFLKVSKPVTFLKPCFHTKFTFILFLWNLINHWAGEDDVSYQVQNEKLTSCF